MTMFQRFWRWLTLADARSVMARLTLADVRGEMADARAEIASAEAELVGMIAAVQNFSWDADSRRRFREYLGRPEVQAELDEIIAATSKPLAPIR